jgi:hypothetical protein
MTLIIGMTCCTDITPPGHLDLHRNHVNSRYMYRFACDSKWLRVPQGAQAGHETPGLQRGGRGKRSRPEEERFGFTMLNCLANEL